MADALYEFGPYRLDTLKHVLGRAVEIVPLTPKALALRLRDRWLVLLRGEPLARSLLAYERLRDLAAALLR